MTTKKPALLSPGAAMKLLPRCFEHVCPMCIKTFIRYPNAIKCGEPCKTQKNRAACKVAGLGATEPSAFKSTASSQHQMRMGRNNF